MNLQQNVMSGMAKTMPPNAAIYHTTEATMKGSSTALETAPLPFPQTPESANAWFIRHGVCKTHWAKAQGLNRMIVVDLLRGRLRGLRGEAHRAAVALGLKADPKHQQHAA